MRIKSFAKVKKKARIEIIPMIDTMFFLLIFFMVATLSMTIMRGVPVNLPKSETAKKDLKENISVTISKDDRIYYNKEEIQLSELRPLLKKDVTYNPDVLVILNADKDTIHGKVIDLIDEVKLSGVTKFAIATKPKR
jgi:biopolymer transport protein ExbD